eukprot:scaffold45168_cov48-Phaeocystis_antarctica.AAC.1
MAILTMAILTMAILTTPYLGRVEFVVTEIIRIAAGEEGKVRHQVFGHEALDSPGWRRLHAQEEGCGGVWEGVE